MGVYEGRGTLTKALKQLEAHWGETLSEWDDSRAREFEQRFLFPLRSDVMMAVSAMDHMAALLNKIEKECE